MELCACNGSFLDKFIQPALLVILTRGENHGFQLISDLEKSGMVSGGSLDPAGLYRTLKRMEANGLVSSRWDTSIASKPRRVYSITDAGTHCLHSWNKTLQDYQSNLSTILQQIDQCLNTNHHI